MGIPNQFTMVVGCSGLKMQSEREIIEISTVVYHGFSIIWGSSQQSDYKGKKRGRFEFLVVFIFCNTCTEQS